MLMRHLRKDMSSLVHSTPNSRATTSHTADELNPGSLMHTNFRYQAIASTPKWGPQRRQTSQTRRLDRLPRRDQLEPTNLKRRRGTSLDEQVHVDSSIVQQVHCVAGRLQDFALTARPCCFAYHTGTCKSASVIVGDHFPKN